MITKMLLLTVVMIFGYAVNCLAMHGHVKNNLSHTSKTFENAISNNNEALVKRLMDKVNRIEFDNRQLQGRVNGMESENKLRVERVVAKNRQLLERVNTLESDNRQLYELLNGIQSENRHLFERLDEMQSKNERADSMDSESKHLREQVRVMEFDIRRLLDKIAILDGREHKEIYGIKTETVKQNEHTDGLELLVKKQQVEIEQLKQMAQMSNENGSASIRTDMHFTMRNKRVIPVQKQDGSKTRIRRAQTDLQVAFFATRSQTQTHMGNLQNVVFDHVETNVGNGYDPYNGLFRAPEAGTYVFAATMVTYNNHSTDYGFFKNTRGVTRLWVNGASNSGDTASQTVILSLNKGDDVTIKHVGNDKTVQGHHYCVFSGFLLFHNETVDPSLVGK